MFGQGEMTDRFSHNRDKAAYPVNFPSRRLARRSFPLIIQIISSTFAHNKFKNN